MHTFQPKHSKLKKEEFEKLLVDYNISLTQLPKIKIIDVGLQGLEVSPGDVIKIERKEEGKINVYFRVAV